MDMVDDNAQYGTPSMILLPSANYKFNVSEETYKITLPRKGKYHEMDPEFFTEEDGEYNLYDEESKIMFLPAISKVLYAAKKYPDLKANQLFAPISLVFTEDEVEIYGQVIDMLNP
jgi:hypothetical protein